MSKIEHSNARMLTAAWGLGLIFIGSLSLIPGDQTNIAMLGLGLLLLGLNLIRFIRQISVSYFSITLGVLFLLLWLWEMISPALGLSFQIDLFPLLLISLGVYLLIPERKGMKTA
jgi:hypothetical protein